MGMGGVVGKAYMVQVKRTGCYWRAKGSGTTANIAEAAIYPKQVTFTHKAAYDRVNMIEVTTVTDEDYPNPADWEMFEKFEISGIGMPWQSCRAISFEEEFGL